MALKPEDDDMIDDVFEGDDEENKAEKVTVIDKKHPSPTGYRDYKPPYVAPPPNEEIDVLHKTILLGDSGVGKTTLLVRFNTGKFQTGNFAATVGIGFTLMLVGDSGVGKTCLLLKFRDKTFLSGTYISTVGVDFRNKIVTVDDAKVKLQIWDTAGQERFRSITHAYYRDAHALLLLFDVTNRSSFDNIRAWLVEIKEYAKEDVVILLLGNKSDCKAADRQVQKEEAEKLASDQGVTFMETSAKSGLNVDLAFTAVAKELMRKTDMTKSEKTEDKNTFSVRDYINEHSSQKTPKCSSCA